MEDSSSAPLLEEEREESSQGCFKRFLHLFDEDDNEDLKDIEPVSFLQLFRFASPRIISIYFLASSLIFLLGFITPVHQWLGGRIATIYIEEKEPIGNDAFLFRVWSWASIYGGMFLIALVVEYTQNYLFTWASEQIGNECRRRFIAAILSRDSLQSQESTGELSNKLSSHIDRMKEGLGEKVGEFIRCLSTFITCCTISFLIDWQTAFILFWSGPVYLLTTLIPKLSANAAKQSLKISEEANGISEESILNVKTVASCNGQNQLIERYSSILQSGISPSLRIAIVSGFIDALSNFLYVIFHCIGLWWATISFHNGRISSAGDVFAVTFLSLSSAGSFSQLGPHLISVMKARAAAAIVYETIDEAEEDSQPSVQPKLDPSRTDLSIEFRDVSFSFPSRDQPVLRNLSFTFQSGESIGLVGKSGCGKSTTLKLLTRFLEEESGSILLDSIPLCDYDKRKWREMIGVVSQEPSLFTGSIRENICLGRDFTEGEIEVACRIAHAHDFIVSLDNGYSTLIGPSGVSLSGGQKQRIAIARAIVSRPRLLLLDEATSALDSKSERIVQKALDSASEGRSTIVVAHRLSTIRNVDRVIVMKEGEIVESGDYSELRMRDGGIFSRMVTEQEMERRASKEGQNGESDDSFEAIEVESTENERRNSVNIFEEEFPSMKGGFIAMISRDKRKTFIIFLLGVLKALASILLSARFFFIFGSLEDTDYKPLLFWLTIGTIAVGLYNFFFQFISHPICQYIGERIMNDLRVSCLRSLLNRPLSYFDRQSTSPSACSILLSQQPPIALSLIDHKLSSVVDGLVACLGVIILTFIVCLPSGIVGVSYLILYLILLLSFEKINDKAYQEVVEVDKSGELAMEIFDNVATIQQLAVESHFQKKFDDILLRRDVPLAKKIRCQSIVHSTNWSIFLLFNFIATTVGVYFVYLGHYSAKELFTTESLVADIGFATYIMSFSFKDIVSASSAAKLLFGLIDPTREKEDEKGIKLNTRGSLKSEKVTFAYPSQPQRNVLTDVSFAVDQGKSIAFVGPSGGGKSTIVNLLERFYDPKTGRILLDHLPFTSLTPFQLRSDISLVSQEPILFRGSIADNIRLGTEGVSESDVKRACDLANATEFITDFPEGYSTLVGEKGRSLSGGQKQRIAIARALVRNPKVIILDEATSALDTQSEKVVRSALESSSRGRTCVIIAHRLDTIRHCDEICFVEEGRIIERGNHDDLMKRRGKYYEMILQQNLH